MLKNINSLKRTILKINKNDFGYIWINGFSKKNIGEGYLEIANHKNHYIKKKDLTSFAEKKWEENYDMVFVGHYHQTGTIIKNDKSLTFLGDWLSKYTVTTLTDDKRWQGNWKEFIEVS